MSLRLKEYLPLVHVLLKLPEADRQILLSHMDNKACTQIELCVAKVLRGRYRIARNQREKLRQCIKANQADLKKVFSRSPTVKRKALAKVGGGLFSLLFSVGIPLLLSLIKK